MKDPGAGLSAGIGMSGLHDRAMSTGRDRRKPVKTGEWGDALEIYFDIGRIQQKDV
jgi:hypothetical protein